MPALSRAKPSALLEKHFQQKRCCGCSSVDRACSFEHSRKALMNFLTVSEAKSVRKEVTTCMKQEGLAGLQRAVQDWLIPVYIDQEVDQQNPSRSDAGPGGLPGRGAHPYSYYRQQKATSNGPFSPIYLQAVLAAGGTVRSHQSAGSIKWSEAGLEEEARQLRDLQ